VSTYGTSGGYFGGFGTLKSIRTVLAKDLVIGRVDIWAKGHLLGVLGFRSR
jgi:hypothetical protein